MTQEILTDVKNTVKAVLNSSTETLSLQQLSKDYKTFDGSDIPYRRLGYSSLLDFLRSIPDTVQLSNPESAFTSVYPVSDGKTAHISQLVGRQKKNTKPKKPVRGPPRQRYQHFNHRPAPVQIPPTEDVIPNDFREDVLKLLRNKQEGIPEREFKAEVMHMAYNYYLDVSYQVVWDDLKKFICVQNNQIYIQNENSIDDNMNVRRVPPALTSHDNNYGFSASDSEDEFEDYPYSDSHSPSNMSDQADNVSHIEPNLTNGNHVEPNSDVIPPRVIKNIQSLIQAEENRNGIWLMDFTQKYMMKFNSELNPKDYGFSEILELMGELQNVVRIKQFRCEGDCLLEDASRGEPVMCEETGSIPTSFINTLKKILTRRSNGSLCTSDLPVEYKKQTGCTLDPKEFGFSCMDSFLKNLSECYSDFHFMPVKNRILIRLNSTSYDAQSNKSAINPDVVPSGLFSPFPVEVCHGDDKLPPDPFFESLQRDDVFQAELAEVYTPWKFFLHYAENMQALNRMMNDLNAFYVENEKEYLVHPMSVTTKGLLCACTYVHDNRWHRVSIVSTKLNTAKVKFVDYGTEENVDFGRLRYLHRDYAMHHAMAIRVKLTGIKTKTFLDSEARIRHYTGLNVHFHHFVSTSSELRAKLINYDAKLDCYEVSLFCISNNERFLASDRLIEENLVDVKTEEFGEFPSNIESPPVITAEPPKSTKMTETSSHLKTQNYETTKEKPRIPSPSVAPVVSPTPEYQKGPPPGLSLPPGAQSRNYNNVFSQPPISKSDEASNVKGSEKKISPKKNGQPLITQPTMANQHIRYPPVQVPSAYMTGLSCATPMNNLLMSPTVPPFSPMVSYAPPPFLPYLSSFPSSYLPSYQYRPPPPSSTAMPNAFTQFLPTVRRPPPGFGPLNCSPSLNVPSFSQSGFVAAPPASFRNAIPHNAHLHTSNRSQTYEPLVTIATTASTDTPKFEWPIRDPVLVSQWEKEMQLKEDRLLSASVSALNLDAFSNEDSIATLPNAISYPDLTAVEKARERQGAESTLKKCFDFTLSSEEIAQSPSGSANDISKVDATAVPPASVPVAEPSLTNSWEPTSPIQQSDFSFSMNAMPRVDLGEPKRVSREADLSGLSSPASSTSAAPTDIVSASNGVSSKASKITSKLNSIKQLVMQHKK